ncbi:GNAT family N-acetyltransferase [Paenibacillus sp. 19GGS1-52]|uniref:GNAT family N-acetyltransferase n=1 Tax=Paenibacillus sp. 19GGS1-52 TaxID=2758563 RepID=UPI001EFB4BD8|nr:GNAT family N-acetyltransferase [Paenibacillus sp. 19GGS1-52]ULO08954.1 GNAT family N-acetyltransferase [Paenibacillus sp. 19GGS1-52]
MSNKTGMSIRLMPKEIAETYIFDTINTDDLNAIAVSMLDAFTDTEDFEGETLEDLHEEIRSVVIDGFGVFIPEASFQIKQNSDIASVILISMYKGSPFVSELFTTKKYMGLGMASSLLNKSINVLWELGYENLVLYVHPRNIGAINLYKKIGFRELE